jgi:hypothetical protein
MQFNATQCGSVRATNAIRPENFKWFSGLLGLVKVFDSPYAKS